MSTLQKKIVLITDVTGKDDSYLSELLLKKGYAAHEVKRRNSLFNTACRTGHLACPPIFLMRYYNNKDLPTSDLTKNHGKWLSRNGSKNI